MIAVRLAAQREVKRQERGVVCSLLVHTGLLQTEWMLAKQAGWGGGGLRGPVLAQQIQLHKHASKTPALSTPL